MLAVVSKLDAEVERRLSAEETAALRAFAATRAEGPASGLALSVLRFVREQGRWLACDCRREGGDFPLIAPRRLPYGQGYTLQVLNGRGRVPHDTRCVFYRTYAPHQVGIEGERATRVRPRGLFAVLRPQGRDKTPGYRHPNSTRREPDGRHVPALSRLLLLLMEEAGLTRVGPRSDGSTVLDSLKALKHAAERFSIARGRPLVDLFSISRSDWDRERLHARVRAAAADWPRGSVAQGFLCCFVTEVEPSGLVKTGAHEPVPVERGILQPFIGGKAVKGPFLFLGVVGFVSRKAGYCCIHGYAQPVVAVAAPIPVDSNYERRAFGTLCVTLRVLRRRFPDATFELEKPVFEIDTKYGRCLPEFLIHARRGGDRVDVVIPLMGFDRPGYLEGKAHTFLRITQLGYYMPMGAKALRHEVTTEGKRVTAAITEMLKRRWSRRAVV